MLEQRNTIAFLCMAILLVLSACSSLPIIDPISPEVTVDRIRLGKFSLRKQKVNIRLKVENPNSFDLPLQTLDFKINVQGDELAKGNSDQDVTIPANSYAHLDVSVSSRRLFKFLFSYVNALKQGEDETAYTIKGFVKLANWPKRIPFDVDGVLEAPDELVESISN